MCNFYSVTTLMKNLRLLSVVTLLVCLLPWSSFPGTKLWAQSVQQGLVFEYNGSDAKTPLPNVVIAAQNAGTAQSAADGSFTLQFRTLHAGDNIQIRRAELAGYEIMNKEVVSNFRVSRQQTDQPIQIVMCTQKRLAEIRNGYRKVASQRYEKQLLASQEEIEKLRANNQLSTEIYNQRMDSLEAEYEEKLQNLENYIEKFARIDVSELDAVEKNITDLVQAGNFDEAVAIYDQQDFPAKLAQSQADRQKLTDAKQKIAEAARQKEMENERIRASIERQVTLLLMAGGEENLRKVLKIRHEVFITDPTHAKARRDYADQLNFLGYTQEAIRLMEEGISITQDPYTEGEMEIQTAYLYAFLDDLEQQYIHISRADSLLWPMRDSHYKVGTRALPIITGCYIKTLPFLGKADELPSFIERQRNYWKPDEQDQVSVSSYTDLLDLMSNFDSENELHEQSLWDAKESLRLNDILGQSGIYYLYESYSFACNIFCFEGYSTEARETSRKAIESICSSYPRSKSTIEILSMLYAANQCIESLMAAEYIDAADSLMNMITELGLYPTIEKRYPDIYVSLRGFYLLNSSYVHVKKGHLEVAEKMMNEAFNLIETNENDAPTLLFLRPSSLAMLSAVKSKYQEAMTLYQEAIKAVLESCENQPSGWDKDNICHYYLGMVDICNQQGEIKQARKWIKEAKKYAAFELDRQLIAKRENK